MYLDTAEQARYKAKSLLVQYFELAFKKMNAPLSWEQVDEIDAIVDLIFDGVIAEIEKRLAQQIQAQRGIDD